MSKIILVNQLSSPERKALGATANWKVEGQDGAWSEVVDPRYGTIQHILVENPDGNPFDKISIIWTPGVFVVVTRVNPETHMAEFLLPEESRILLRDAQGVQGNRKIRNIPQGIIKTWINETSAEAAAREVQEETGYKPRGLALLGEIGFDIPNSGTLMTFYLAVVPYAQKPTEQMLESSEEIKIDWFTWLEAKRLTTPDGKTHIGFGLMEGVVDPTLLGGRFDTTPRYDAFHLLRLLLHIFPIPLHRLSQSLRKHNSRLIS